MPNPTDPAKTVTYYAISMFSSRTFWWNAANFALAVLSQSEVTVLIPPRYLSLQVAVVTLGNLWLRSQTVRPAVIMAPGNVQPVTVAKLPGAVTPPVVTD